MSKTFPVVLQVLPSLHSGGVEKATLDMVKGIKQNHPGMQTYVASAGGMLMDEVCSNGGYHVTLPLNTKSPIQIYKNTQKLVDLIKTHNIQLIHARSRAPAWSALRAARLTGIPFITTYHGVYNSDNPLKSFYNSVMARGDRVIAISGYVADHIQKHYPQFASNVVVILEGIDTSFFDPFKITQNQVRTFRQEWGLPSDHKLILLPGRLTRWKGQTILLKALHLMDHSNLTVVFLGDDQNRTDYHRELESLSKGLSVKFIPSYSNMPVAYAAADLVVSCSTDPEAFGRITAEALSMGRPYIGTNHGATPEMCINEQTGFLVPPGDAEALANKIEVVFSKMMNINMKAREHIENNFSLTKMIEKTLELYRTSYKNKVRK